ncbi:MAG TPA: alkaline phosphatase PhoX [Thermoleophilaceae bacterium]
MLSLALALAVLGVVGSAAPAVAKKDGFRTSRPAFLKQGDIPGVSITPLLTVGDRIGAYRYEAVPDGISLKRKDHNRVEAFINHETGKSPFPWNVNGGNTQDNAENDFDNSQLSRLTFNGDAEVLHGSLAITSPLGYQRFCSNYLATWRESFNRPVLFTNEETPDYFLRQESSWPGLPIGRPDEKEGGLVVAVQPKSGKQRTIPGMGRHNHENSVPIPGYGHPVVLSGDDPFTSGPLSAVGTTPSQPAQSQLYSYIAKSANDVLKDRGDLWAFVSDNPAIDDYYDVLPGSGTQVSGHFIKVPRDIATGLNPDGSETRAADHGYPAPPSDGTWQPEPRFQGPNPVPGVDGPQWVLNHWSDVNNVFQFVRVEDIAYDKRPGMGNVVYIADSGRGRRADQSQDTPNFRSTNGRVWKMVFDKDDPTTVTSLSVFVEGDDNPVKTPNEIHQPDNLETTPNGLLVAEDPGSSQQFAADDASGTTARLWYVPIANPAGAQVAAKVDQSEDGRPGDTKTDVDGRAPGNQGAWESTGVIDASRFFGAGAFLINIQAHTLWIEKKLGEDNFAPTGPDFMYKREGGQLLLIRIPGG